MSIFHTLAISLINRHQTVMKNTLLFWCAALFPLLASAQLTGLVAEIHASHENSEIAALEGLTTYRIYAVMTQSTDEVSAIYGDSSAPMLVASTTGFFQSTIGGDVGWTINSAFFSFFPDAAFDSWFTIGSANQAESVGQPNMIGLESAFSAFNSGGEFDVSTSIGGSFFTLAGDPMAQAGDDLKVLIGQLTSAGEISGYMNLQIFVEGLQSQSLNYVGIELDFGGSIGTDIEGCTSSDADNYNPEATSDDGSCVIGGCTYTGTSNFNALATYDDGSCSFEGCTNSAAVNFDEEASVEDGTCIWVGCLDPVSLNFDLMANFAGPCDYSAPCMADLDGDGGVDIIDLLLMFESYGYVCE